MAESFIHTPRVKLGWLIGVAAAFFIFVVIGSYSARMTNDFSGYDKQRADKRYETLAKVRHDESALLEPVDKQGKPTATWADQDKGTIKISIEEAMQHAVDDLKTKPVAIGAEIPGTAPKPAAIPTNAPAASAPATNAPAASTNAVPAKPGAKIKAGAKSTQQTPPSAPDEKNKPASPSASTTAPTPSTPATH